MCHRVKPTAVHCAVVSHSLLHRVLLRRRTAFFPLVPFPREPPVFPPFLLASDSKVILTRYGSVPLRSFLVFASDLRSVSMPSVFFFFWKKKHGSGFTMPSVCRCFLCRLLVEFFFSPS
jgi:hypothetical protein